MKRLSFLFLLLAAAAHAQALKLPALFSEHMVLQSGEPVPVWGWGRPGSTVEIAFAGQKKNAQVAPDGTWKIVLSPLSPAKSPATMTVAGDATISIPDVLVGEVWLGSGQSNMSFPASRSPKFEEDKRDAELPTLRMFTVTSLTNPARQSDCEGKWTVCTPTTFGAFSAVAYFFGRDLVRELDRPVGLINASTGGTCIEAWTPLEAQQAVPELKPMLDHYAKTIRDFDLAATERQDRDAERDWAQAAAVAQASGKAPPRKSGSRVAAFKRSSDLSGLYNAKIAPLIPYRIRGVIWYQGEGNATPQKAPFYETQMRLLVREWRARWGYDFPFAWVQLPNLVRVESWVHVREAQFRALDLPSTGMVVTTDLGEANNLHPLDKRGIGARLALWALGTVYKKKSVVSSGPLYTSCTIEGPTVTVRFRHAESGLRVVGERLAGFELAGSDRRWHPAEARLVGDTVALASPAVLAPVAARYAWKDNPPTTLYNAAGLPASPFRTDTWPLFE